MYSILSQTLFNRTIHQVAQEFAKTFTAQWYGGLREKINSAWDEYCDFPIIVRSNLLYSSTKMFIIHTFHLQGERSVGRWVYGADDGSQTEEVRVVGILANLALLLLLTSMRTPGTNCIVLVILSHIGSKMYR